LFHVKRAALVDLQHLLIRNLATVGDVLQRKANL
jgi:hypothetical protein